jgi:thiol-disulfide isomerase/thioredoxin
MNSIIKALCTALTLMIATSLAQADTILSDVYGKTISFSSLKGKWVLINYWASWCKSCVDEIPELNLFYQKHQNDPVALFAVNYDALPLYKQKRLIQQLQIKYPSLSTNPAMTLGLGDIIGVPVTFVINPQGKLVDKLYGGQSIKSLDAAIS